MRNKTPFSSNTENDSFDVDPSLKNLLKIKRWEAGLKQYELANQLGCSAPYLSMVENGRMQPPQEFMEKAAEVLQIEISKLFPENDSGSQE